MNVLCFVSHRVSHHSTQPLQTTGEQMSVSVAVQLYLLKHVAGHSLPPIAEISLKNCCRIFFMTLP